MFNNFADKRAPETELDANDADVTTTGDATPAQSSASASVNDMEIDGIEVPTLSTPPEPIVIVSAGSQSYGTWLSARAKYIPLRLTQQERKLLRLCVYL